MRAAILIKSGCIDENQTPDAVDDAASVDEDSSVIVSVLANDADADGDSLTIDSVSAARQADTAAINGDGTVTYTPDADYCGADSFEYTVTDGELTDTATVTVTVNCVEENTCPVAMYDIYDDNHEHSAGCISRGRSAR